MKNFYLICQKMNSYVSKLQFFEENIDGIVPSSVEIVFSINEFQFGSHIYNFDESSVEDVGKMIDAMSGNLTFARICQGYSNGSSTITCQNGIVTFETSHFAQTTSFRCVVNQSLIDTFIVLQKYYSSN